MNWAAEALANATTTLASSLESDLKVIQSNWATQVQKDVLAALADSKN